MFTFPSIASVQKADYRTANHPIRRTCTEKRGIDSDWTATARLSYTGVKRRRLTPDASECGLALPSLVIATTVGKEER